ncbi:MAG TPA: hypothetical protein VKU77_26530 [Streptosporangiaceae bacterium]|nr:hypothetical protein [Streptosporangiaceae bacterium]
MKITRILKTAGIPAAVLAVTVLTTAGSCGGQSAGQATENKAQQQDEQSLVTDQPVPHYNWSQIRQTLIDAQDISANETQTTSFFFQMGLPDPVFSCPSIGMPVASTAQLTNPAQVVTQDSQGNGITGSAVIGQMDPNGIYTPSASTGTYVICVNSSGADYLEYWEGDVMTVTSAATWDRTGHTVRVYGAPTAAVHVKAAR